MKNRLVILLTAATAGLLLLLLGTPSVAAATPTSDTTQKQIDEILTQHPGGVQTSDDSITWNSGVVLKLGVGPSGLESCPSDSLCLWEHDNFGGRLVVFPGALCGLNLVFNFNDIAFNDQASSWANTTTNRFANVWEDFGAGGARLWQMFPGFNSPGLPKALNDKASSLTC